MAYFQRYQRCVWRYKRRVAFSYKFLSEGCGFMVEGGRAVLSKGVVLISSGRTILGALGVVLTHRFGAMMKISIPALLPTLLHRNSISVILLSVGFIAKQRSKDRNLF